MHASMFSLKSLVYIIQILLVSALLGCSGGSPQDIPDVKFDLLLSDSASPGRSARFSSESQSERTARFNAQGIIDESNISILAIRGNASWLMDRNGNSLSGEDLDANFLSGLNDGVPTPVSLTISFLAGGVTYAVPMHSATVTKLETDKQVLFSASETVESNLYRICTAIFTDQRIEISVSGNGYTINLGNISLELAGRNEQCNVQLSASIQPSHMLTVSAAADPSQSDCIFRVIHVRTADGLLRADADTLDLTPIVSTLSFAEVRDVPMAIVVESDGNQTAGTFTLAVRNDTGISGGAGTAAAAAVQKCECQCGSGTFLKYFFIRDSASCSALNGQSCVKLENDGIATSVLSGCTKVTL